MIFIDEPKYFSLNEYKTAIDAMVNKLKKQTEILAIYQIGSVSSIGISDIDMVIIFKDNVSCKINPLENLSDNERYLFIHSLFGLPHSLFKKAKKYTFFHNYNLLYGEDIFEENNDINYNNEVLKKQIAIEYLLKMYIVMSMQKHYNIVKLRSLLLEAKAIKYDLEFLGNTDKEIHLLLEKLFNWRQTWFNSRPSNEDVENWFNNFYNEMFTLIDNFFKNDKYYNLYADKSLVFSKNIHIENQKKFSVKHSGTIGIPFLAKFMERKYFNLLHRLNKFNFTFPMEIPEKDSIIYKKIIFELECEAYNKKRLPHFSILKSSLGLTIKAIK